MSISEVKVPDIGDFQDVEVLELMCKEGQSIDVEDPIITIESEKATMDVPSPLAGKIIKINVVFLIIFIFFGKNKYSIF